MLPRASWDNSFTVDRINLLRTSLTPREQVLLHALRKDSNSYGTVVAWLVREDRYHRRYLVIGFDEAFGKNHDQLLEKCLESSGFSNAEIRGKWGGYFKFSEFNMKPFVNLVIQPVELTAKRHTEEVRTAILSSLDGTYYSLLTKLLLNQKTVDLIERQFSRA